MGIVEKLVLSVAGGLLSLFVRAMLRAYLHEDPAIWLAQRFKSPKPRRIAEVFRWGSATAIAIVIFVALQFWGVWGPKDGDPANAPFSIDDHKFVPPNKDVGLPPGINVYFTPSVPFTGCVRGILLWPTIDISNDAMTENFRMLVAEQDVLNARECNAHFSPNQKRFNSAFPMPPQFLLGGQLNEVNSGIRSLYALFVWKYSLDSDPKAYFITQECIVFNAIAGTGIQVCPGDFNKTWRHIVK